MSAYDDDPPSTDPYDSDEYKEDPDAAPTVEGRVQQAMVEMRKLLKSALFATLGMGLLIAVWDVAKGQSFDNLVGFLIGAATATLNLWLLAGGFFAMMRGQAMSLRSLLAFGGSFLGLVLLAIFVVLARREWTFGFSLGLTTPAVAGILYSRTLKDR